jgi:hypothetical protein
MEYLIEKSNPIAQEFPPLSNNYTVYVDCREMLKSVQLDLDIQRELDMNWVNELKGNVMKHKKQHGYYLFGTFEVACLDNSLYMLNGQHRYFVLRDLANLCEEDEEIPVEIKIYTVSTLESMRDLWMKVNGSKPYKLCKSTSKQVILNSIKKYFVCNYPNFITEAEKPMKPHINLRQLEEAIEEHKVIDTLKIESSEEFITMIEKINNYYKYLDVGKWKQWGFDEAIVHKCKLKNILKPLFLGIFTNFEWIKRILALNSDPPTIDNYNSIPHLGLNAKSRKISKVKRRKVWEKRNSKKSMIG